MGRLGSCWGAATATEVHSNHKPCRHLGNEDPTLDAGCEPNAGRDSISASDESGTTSTWTEVQGLQMHARRAITAPAPGAASIILVHGLGVSSRYMIPTLRLLSAAWDVTAPDLPGFGLSDRPRHTFTLAELASRLADWMSAVGLARAVLLGNSLGCQVITTLASVHPERVRAAVLVGPTMDPSAASPARELARLLLDGPRERPSEAWLALGDYRRAGTRRIWQTLVEALGAPVADQLRSMQMPTLVVRGGRDPIVSASWAQQVADLLPAGRLVVLPDAPHAANYSAADALVSAVVPFLHGLPP